MRKEGLEIWLPCETREKGILDDGFHAVPMVIRNFQPLHQRQSG
jgi:hypothetical protein